jgi:hypothetical protein
VVVARVVVAMVMVLIVLGDVMMLVGVSADFVGRVFVSVLFVDYVEGHCVVLIHVMLNVLFVCLSDYCH